jgi:hypothetical protein
MAKLDMVLAYVEWDIKLPEAKVTILPKGVSDHNPLIITSGSKPPYEGGSL